MGVRSGSLPSVSGMRPTPLATTCRRGLALGTPPGCGVGAQRTTPLEGRARQRASRRLAGGVIRLVVYNVTEMPLAQPPADTCRIDVNYTYELAECTTVHRIYIPGGSSDPVDLLALLGAFVGIGIANLIELMSAALVVNTARLDYSDGTSSVIVMGGFSTIAGTHGGGVLPASDAAVISWLGGWNYRGGKPRTYLPGLTQDRLASTQSLDLGFTASLAARAIDTLSEWAAIPSAHPAFPVVTPGVLLGNTVASPGTFAPFTGCVVRPQIGEQRRRNRN